MQLRAAVDISPGDELTISYIDCLATRQQRRRKLQVTSRHAFTFHNRFQCSSLFVGSLIMASLAAALVACRWWTRMRRPGVSCAALAGQQLTALWSYATLLPIRPLYLNLTSKSTLLFLLQNPPVSVHVFPAAAPFLYTFAQLSLSAHATPQFSKLAPDFSASYPHCVHGPLPSLLQPPCRSFPPSNQPARCCQCTPL